MVSIERQRRRTSKDFTATRTFGLDLKNEGEEQQLELRRGEDCSGGGNRVSTAVRKERRDVAHVSGGRRACRGPPPPSGKSGALGAS